MATERKYAMRRLSDWLEAYQEYTTETESSPDFNLWVGISTIASALRKKTWLELGRLKVFPNLYVVLVAEPGVARKSQAISYASDIISDIPSIIVGADSTTAQSLMQELEESTTYDRLPDGTALRHASLSIISREFESFLGSASANKMLVTLTDLFDAGEKPWKHRTKSSGTSMIPSVYLNILGATTPRSLQECLSSLAVGGGLTSRILFIYSDKKHKKIAVPEMTARIRFLKEQLIHDLESISAITGSLSFAVSSLDYWKKWYEAYDETSEKRLQPRKEFDGWYSRKPLLIQKVAIILSASQSNSRVIEIEHLQKAITLVEEVEKGMGNVLTDQVMRNTGGYETSVILRYVKQHKQIAEKHLMQLIWRDVDEYVFDNFMDVLLKEGSVVRSFENPTTKVEEIWYSIKEE